MARFRPVLRLICRRKLKSGELTAKQSEAVRTLLKHRTAIAQVEAECAKIKGYTKMMGQIEALGDGAILAWLTEHWEEILKLILMIVSAFL